MDVQLRGLIIFILIFSSWAIFADGENSQPVFLSTEIKAKIAEVAKDSGRIIPENEIPHLYDLMRKAFERVAKVQQKRIEKSYVPINYYFIIDSPISDAFVVNVIEPGISISKQLMFMTTGMLHEQLNLNEQALRLRYPHLSHDKAVDAELSSGANRVAGVSARELAHPEDNMAKEGFSIVREYGQRASQAIELKADGTGMMFLRAANLPEEALLDSLERVIDFDAPTSLLESLVEGHPEVSLRATLTRMFLTLSRFQQGNNQDVSPFTVADFNREGLIRDLNHIKVGGGPLPWRMPKTLEEVARRFRNIGRIESTTHQQIELNRLVLAMDDLISQIERSGREVPESVTQEIISTFQFLKRTGRFPDVIWTQPLRIEALKNAPDSQALHRLPTHFRSVQKLKFYRNPKWIEAMERMSDFDSEEMERHRRYLMSLVGWIPAPIILQRHLNDFIEQKAQPDPQRGIFKDDVTKIVRREILIPILVSVQQRYGRVTGFGPGFTRLLNEFEGSHIPFFISSPFSFDDLYEANRNLERIIRQTRVLAKQNHSDSVKAWKQIVDYTQWFWDNRGFFATTELLTSNIAVAQGGGRARKINWSLVAEILNLDSRQIGNQIAKSVEGNLNGTYPAELTQWMASSTDENSRIEQQVEVQGWQARGAQPFWLNDRITRRIVEMNQNTVPIVNDGVVKDPPAAMLFGRALLSSDPVTRIKVYQDHVQKYLSKPLNSEASIYTVDAVLMKMEDEFQNQWLLSAIDGLGQTTSSFLGLARGISQSSLNKDAKKLYLQFVFLRDKRFNGDGKYKFASFWYQWTEESRKDVKEITDILISHGIAKDYLDVVKQLIGSRHYRPFADAADLVGTKNERVKTLEAYYQALDHLVEGLLPELVARNPLTKDILIEYAGVLNSPYRLEVKRTESNKPNIREYRDAIMRRARELTPHMSDVERIKFFLLVTGSGPSFETDAFFASHLLGMPRFTANKEQLNWLKGVLLARRIDSEALKLKVAKIALSVRLEELAAKPKVSVYELDALISDLNLMVPGGSLARDEYLESIAWKLRLKDMSLFAFIEDQKASNWRRQNPHLVNAGSVLAGVIKKMSRSRRRSFALYLMDPKSKEYTNGIPEDLFREFRDILLREILEKQSPQERVTSRKTAERQSDDMAREVKQKIEGYLRDSAPTERIPLLEMVLSAGPTALLKGGEPAWVEIAREFLGYDAESEHEKILLAYLTIIKNHERAPSLAYILSQARADKTTSANLFTVFGTVGIKFAQLASIWKLFGPQIAEETKHLKNKAPPLSRFEIYRQMEEYLHEQFGQEIELEKILGSASIKTIVRVRLPDGRRVVMALQPSVAPNQIATNLELGKQFLDELERRNLVQHSRMLAELIDSLKSQLSEELDFELEAQRFAIAKQHLQAYNKSERSLLKGWTFEVPTLIQGLEGAFKSEASRKKIAFYEGAWEDDQHLDSAVTFDELEKELENGNLTKEQRFELEQELHHIGELLVRSSLAMLFRYGHFDADRHKGNWLIDKVHKKIYALDFGQLETFDAKNPFLYDPRLTVAQFLEAFDKKNVEGIYWALTNMRRPETKAPSLTPELIARMKKALAKSDYSDQLIDLVTAITEAGFKLDRRYNFGALKGLMILYGEQYVSKEKFKEILKEEGMTLARRKLPALAIHQAQKAISCTIGLRSAAR